MFDNFLEDHPRLEGLLQRYSGTGEGSIPTDEIVLRLLAACAIGWLIGFVYRRTFTGKRFSPTLPDTHLLLCVGGAMIWLVVGDNLVRAFGLAGTIGLIRYRTVVRDPKDTTILLFSMILGMACGLGQIPVALIGVVVVILVMITLHHRHAKELAVMKAKGDDLLDLIGADDDDEPPKGKKPRKGEDYDDLDDY